MFRVAFAQLRRRPARALALLLGVLVAVTGFTVLTASTATSRLVVTQTVEQNSRGAYDILVRPAGSRTDLEARRQLVEPNFLAGQYGGITAQQWRQIQALPDVEIAAPIAMLGYGYARGYVNVDLTDLVDRSAERQFIDSRHHWRADRGLTDISEGGIYLYVTRRPVEWRPDTRDCNPPDERVWEGDPSWGAWETQEDGRQVEVCLQKRVAFEGSIYPSVVQLTSDGKFLYPDIDYSLGTPVGPPHGPRDRLMIPTPVSMPLLVAAVDPEREADLVGLDHAVVKGRYLQPDDAARGIDAQGFLTVPALLTSRPQVDQQVVDTGRRCDLGGRTLADVTYQGYQDCSWADTARSPSAWVTDFYRTDVWEDGGEANFRVELGASVRQGIGPVRVTALQIVDTGPGALQPQPQPAASSSWPSCDTCRRAPPGARDTGFRTAYADLVGSALAYTMTVGVFDPSRLPQFNPLAQVPLGTYEAASASGATAADQKLLRGQPLLPNDNPAGFFTAPPSVLLPLNVVLEHGTSDAPISAVRVRVGGVSGLDDVSRERVRRVAEQITTTTGLDVDITLGASPTAQTIDLAAGKFGRPQLSLTQFWSKKGVAQAILQAIDRKSVILSGLVLIVCVLFLTNAVGATVADRRRELAVLACLGWSRRRLAGTIALEAGLIGAAAGLIGALASIPIGWAAGISVHLANAVLAAPAAVGLALVASLLPAWRASRTHPGAALAPVAARTRRGLHHGRNLAGLALINLNRRPGRTAFAATALGIAIAALTVVAAITTAFHGAVTGSLLGDAVSLRVRAVDLAAVATTLALGLTAVADVLYLNIRDRAAELAVLRASGWSTATIARLITYEAAMLGLLGSVLGAGIGIGAMAWFAGQLTPALLWLAGAVSLSGMLLTALAALVPALAQQRATLAPVLAAD